MFNSKDYEIKNTTRCECGHEFTIKDFIELKRINEPRFYANQVKHYSPTKCPTCNKETILLLKQVGQTYAVVDTAVLKQQAKAKNTVAESENKIETKKETTQEFICPECKKVCKNQLGLNAHMRTHQN